MTDCWCCLVDVHSKGEGCRKVFLRYWHWAAVHEGWFAQEGDFSFDTRQWEEVHVGHVHLDGWLVGSLSLLVFMEEHWVILTERRAHKSNQTPSISLQLTSVQWQWFLHFNISCPHCEKAITAFIILKVPFLHFFLSLFMFLFASQDSIINVKSELINLIFTRFLNWFEGESRTLIFLR